MSTNVGDYLISIRALDRHGLDLALEVQKRNRRRLDEILRAQRLVPSTVLAQALATLARYDYLEPERAHTAVVWADALRAFGEEWWRQYDLVPCELDEQKIILSAYPFHLREIDRVRQRWSDIAIVVTTAEVVQKHLSHGVVEHRRVITESVRAVESHGIESGHLPTVLRTLINLALERGASDVHIEPLNDSVVVRCRVDGLLQPLYALQRQYHPNIINILWEWAQLKHGVTMEVQDGHFRHDVPGGQMDVRLSAIPGQDGPSIVLRLLEQGRGTVQLDGLGYTPSRAKAIADLLRIPFGLILVTGPTGSGKSTTLYAVLNSLNAQDIKIVTVEDPVEVRLARVQQVSIHEGLGTTFGVVTRAFLRHDPDVIMIGEVRDQETAREAIRAALTGRRVLSTLHTQNSFGAIPRLLELGVEHGLLAETLIGVIAQRLVRVRCRACGGGSTINEPNTPACPTCRGTGAVGRTVVTEVLTVTHAFRALIERRPTTEDIRALAEEEHFSSMADDALTRIAEGQITLEEAERVLGPIGETVRAE